MTDEQTNRELDQIHAELKRQDEKIDAVDQRLQEFRIKNETDHANLFQEVKAAEKSRKVTHEKLDKLITTKGKYWDWFMGTIIGGLATAMLLVIWQGIKQLFQK